MAGSWRACGLGARRQRIAKAGRFTKAIGVRDVFETTLAGLMKFLSWAANSPVSNGFPRREEVDKVDCLSRQMTSIYRFVSNLERN